MESVFVSESLIDINQLASDASNKLKIGEIFQLRDNTLSMCCTNCFQEFQYFTEFSLHIQDHFLRGEIAQLKEIKEEIRIEVQTPYNESSSSELLVLEPEIKCEVLNQGENDDFFDYDSDFAWSNHSDDQSNPVEGIEPMRKWPENVYISATLNPPASQPIVEGTDYEKVEDKFKCLTCDHVTAKLKHLKEHVSIHTNVKHVVCPLCNKLFASISYVRKHLNRTHQVKMSGEEIKKAQPFSNSTDVVDLPPVFVSAPLPTTPVLDKPEPTRKTCVEAKSFVEDVDYSRSDNGFNCLTCTRQMAKWDHMKEHLLTHSSEKNVYCPLCAQAFITESYVRKHVNRTHKQRITAEEIKAAQSNIDIAQTKERWMAAQEKKMAKQVKLNRAKATTTSSEEGTIRCLDCIKWFTKPRYAQKHMRLIHAKMLTIGELISAQLSLPNIVYDDGDDIGDGGGNESVEEVQLIVKTESNDTDTKNTESDKCFECFECRKKFARTNSLRIHMKLHSGVKFSCPYCDKVFAMKSYVRDHIVIMHGIKRSDIPKEIITQASGNYTYSSRPIIAAFECYLCRNQYKKRNRLREHMNSHLSGPYLCEICSAVYKTTDTLRHHMEKHKANGARYECPDCSKTYPTRRYMLSHYRTIHLNKRRKKPELPKKSSISCEICGQSFTNRHNLKMHMTGRCNFI